MMKNKFEWLSRMNRRVKALLGYDVLIKPDVKCHTLRYGEKEYDWVFCPDGLGENSIAYSFGIGHNISYDLALIDNFKLQVFAFDPTPKSLNWLETQTLPAAFHWFPFGLSDQDGAVDFFPVNEDSGVSFTELTSDDKSTTRLPVHLQVKRLDTIRKLLNHQHIDILKMDIEGSEYKVIPDIMNANPPIAQLLVEFHHHLPNIGISKTVEAIKTLHMHGYRIFNISPRGFEYSFIKE